MQHDNTKALADCNERRAAVMTSLCQWVTAGGGELGDGWEHGPRRNRLATWTSHGGAHFNRDDVSGRLWGREKQCMLLEVRVRINSIRVTLEMYPRRNRTRTGTNGKLAFRCNVGSESLLVNEPAKGFDPTKLYAKVLAFVAANAVKVAERKASDAAQDARECVAETLTGVTATYSGDFRFEWRGDAATMRKLSAIVTVDSLD